MTWPTEAQLTVATTAAAKAHFQRFAALAVDGTATWEDLHPVTRQEIMQTVLPIVHDALLALEDPRGVAFEEGLVACVQHGPNATNPY